MATQNDCKGEHNWDEGSPNMDGIDSKCSGCGAMRHSLARLVAEGIIGVALPRPDTHLLKYIVNGCFTCGGPESAERSFTTYYWNEERKLQGSWLCQPCIQTICQDEGRHLILRNLSTEDILVRTPGLREAYLQGKVCRTLDVPAGFVLKEGLS